MDAIADRARKGRGAVSNPTGRYEPARRVAIDDGWGSADAEPPPLKTTVGVDATRQIITTNDSPDIPFDRSINPYRGCEHGCVYCFARPTHAWLGLSPGLDFESKLFAKPMAASLLDKELRNPRYRCQPIAMGTNTDPYQPVEREMRVTRQILEVLSAFEHPVTIVTKSALVLRDLDILAPMAARGLAAVAVSVTTLDRDLARRMEPRAATPERRLETIRALAEAGVPAGVMAAPMIPALNDWELERILEASVAAGATTASYVVLRLPLELDQLFQEWLTEHVPGRAAHVMSIVRQMRGGKSYDSRWGQRMRGTGVHADLLAKRYRLAMARLGLGRRDWRLDTSRFRPPPRAGDQLSLL
ncbi:DNA repair photolyase [Stella humosa]|uniref:DNA repair photolyase n=1 Tax=Stella humosa TaxID=94 RepID=A0A3N1KZR6_9PROT|nr:PA0069 family radical SAM protein [Stella humosa]ROP84677.1 DNA repair photolyase [Stella humosa]BBK34197.1 radical SAM protein [Stella humosa]